MAAALPLKTPDKCVTCGFFLCGRLPKVFGEVCEQYRVISQESLHTMYECFKHPPNTCISMEKMLNVSQELIISTALCKDAIKNTSESSSPIGLNEPVLVVNPAVVPELYLQSNDASIKATPPKLTRISKFIKKVKKTLRMSYGGRKHQMESEAIDELKNGPSRLSAVEYTNQKQDLYEICQQSIECIEHFKVSPPIFPQLVGLPNVRPAAALTRTLGTQTEDISLASNVAIQNQKHRQPLEHHEAWKEVPCCDRESSVTNSSQMTVNAIISDTSLARDRSDSQDNVNVSLDTSSDNCRLDNKHQNEVDVVASQDNESKLSAGHHHPASPFISMNTEPSLQQSCVSDQRKVYPTSTININHAFRQKKVGFHQVDNRNSNEMKERVNKVLQGQQLSTSSRPVEHIYDTVAGDFELQENEQNMSIRVVPKTSINIVDVVQEEEVVQPRSWFFCCCSK